MKTLMQRSDHRLSLIIVDCITHVIHRIPVTVLIRAIPQGVCGHQEATFWGSTVREPITPQRFQTESSLCRTVADSGGSLGTLTLIATCRQNHQPSLVSFPPHSHFFLSQARNKKTYLIHFCPAFVLTAMTSPIYMISLNVCRITAITATGVNHIKPPSDSS